MNDNREQRSIQRSNRCQSLGELLEPYRRLIAEHSDGKPPTLSVNGERLKVHGYNHEP